MAVWAARPRTKLENTPCGVLGCPGSIISTGNWVFANGFWSYCFGTQTSTGSRSPSGPFAPGTWAVSVRMRPSEPSAGTRPAAVTTGTEPPLVPSRSAQLL